MIPVPEWQMLPVASGRTVADVTLWQGILIRILTPLLRQFGYRINRVLPKDGTEAMTAPLPLAQYTTATKPAASTANKGTIIFVSDGGAGNVFQGSNGTAWVALG